MLVNSFFVYDKNQAWPMIFSEFLPLCGGGKQPMTFVGLYLSPTLSVAVFAFARWLLHRPCNKGWGPFLIRLILCVMWWVALWQIFDIQYITKCRQWYLFLVRIRKIEYPASSKILMWTSASYSTSHCNNVFPAISVFDTLKVFIICQLKKPAWWKRINNPPLPYCLVKETTQVA